MAALGPAVICPYCRSQIQLAPGDLAELRTYQSHVSGQLARAQREHEYAEGWNRWYGTDDARKKSHPLLPLFLWIAMVIPLGFFGWAVSALDLSGEIVKLLPVAFVGLFMLVLCGYMFWFYSGRRTQKSTAVLRAVNVHCPACGAPHQLAAGDVLDRCRFCSAPLLPDARVMDHGRAEADRVALEAEIARARAERRGMTMLSSSSAANAVPYIVLGSFLPMTLFGSIGFTFSFLMGNEPDTPIGGLALLWLLTFVNAGLIALVYVYRRTRKDRVVALGQALVARFGGAVLADQWAMNNWMDRHWAGLIPMQQMFRGAYFTSVACAVEGYPVLYVLNPVGAAEGYPAFVSLRVSAWLTDPHRLGREPVVERVRGLLRAHGFSLELTRAGLTALALKKSAERVVKSDPRALGDAALELARAARSIGGTPVDIPA
jgi:hypothetical protein